MPSLVSGPKYSVSSNNSPLAPRVTKKTSPCHAMLSKTPKDYNFTWVNIKVSNIVPAESAWADSLLKIECSSS